MKHSTFAERLAYARFVYHLRTGDAPGNATIGRAVNRTGPWVTKWAASDTPPRDFIVHAPLARFLGVDELWLIRGQGEPPRPELWKQWLEGRDERAAAVSSGGLPAQRPSKAKGKKRA